MKYRLILASFALVTLPMGAQPENLSPKFDSHFYYRIGGGRTFTSAPKLQITNIQLSLKASLTGLACGRFDPNVTISNTLNRVKDGVEDSMQQLENAAGAAIAALPGYILQSIDPGLYDLFMNSVFRAEESFSLATKSCEKISAEMARGEDPFEELVTVSIGDTWKANAGVGGVDVVDIENLAASPDATNAGVPWIGNQRAGGENMDPAFLITDPAKAGYNIILNRQPTDDTPVVQDDNTPPLAQRFTEPDEIRTWLQVVVGDVFASSCEGCPKGGISGQGMRTLLESEKDIVELQLQELYDGTVQPTLENLQEASAPEVILTRQVLETIQAQENNDASIFLSKLTDEIAMSRVINDALLVLQTLRAGEAEANVLALAPAAKNTKKAQEVILAEIDSLMTESEIKKKLVSSTVTEVLDMGYAQQRAGLSIDSTLTADPRPMLGGAIEEEAP